MPEAEAASIEYKSDIKDQQYNHSLAHPSPHASPPWFELLYFRSNRVRTSTINSRDAAASKSCSPRIKDEPFDHPLAKTHPSPCLSPPWFETYSVFWSDSVRIISSQRCKETLFEAETAVVKEEPCSPRMKDEPFDQQLAKTLPSPCLSPLWFEIYFVFWPDSVRIISSQPRKETLFEAETAVVKEQPCSPRVKDETLNYSANTLPSSRPSPIRLEPLFTDRHPSHDLKCFKRSCVSPWISRPSKRRRIDRLTRPRISDIVRPKTFRFMAKARLMNRIRSPAVLGTKLNVPIRPALASSKKSAYGHEPLHPATQVLFSSTTDS